MTSVFGIARIPQTKHKLVQIKQTLTPLKEQQMTSKDTQTDMPPSSIAKAIKFGPFTVTSQVYLSLLPPLPPPTFLLLALTLSSQTQVFYKTTLTYCLVNLKPLLPGHILVCPLRSVPHLSDLRPAELHDLFSVVQLCSVTLKRLYNAPACNIAIQDGEAAGQSVKHVHCHVIPRKDKDMDERGGGDAIYEELEGVEGDVRRWQREQEEGEGEERQGKAKFPKHKDEDRKARSMEEMEKEAAWLAEEILKDVREREGANGSSL